ncbi:MAG TPA: TonB-dependent receptor [Candidatus Acidoferrum sp.]|nr:TonB-dependent receptor [Candidatus Acidoferrum sp.]
MNISNRADGIVVGCGRKTKGIWAAVFILLLGTVLLPQFASAQRLDGTLRVTVSDKTGAEILDAKVTVTNEATNVALTATASSAGTYVFPDLLVGTYTVTVEKEGFKKTVNKGVQVESNQVAEVAATLEVGDATAVVEVTAGAELVKTESSELGTSFSEQVVHDLPLNTLGGDVKEFAVFAPGTTTQEGGVLGSGGSIGGNRPRFNGFSIDGVDDNRVDVNGPTQPVIQESVAEFTLLTNQFSAEYGHSAGGQFNIVTKSGTNNWHGAGWEYNRNRDLNAATDQEIAAAAAKEAAGQPVPDVKNRFDYNRLGGSAGGPILKDKFFIYGAYEFQNEGLGSQGATVLTPTANGMSQLMALNPDSAVAAVLKQFPIAATKTGTTNVTFNGTTQAIDIGQFAGVAPSYFREHDFTINGDVNLGKHQLRGRVLYDRERAPQVNPIQPQSQFTGENQSDARKYIFTDAWTLSSRVINDLRASFSRLNGPNIVTPSQFANFPNVEIDEFGSNLGPYSLAPQGYKQNIYQLVDNVSYIRGKHTFKAGMEGRNYITETDSLPRARGEWDYATLNTFINDLVPDGGNGALRGAGTGTSANNNPAVYWFVQDDWKLAPRLTVNLGLRYEWSGVPRDEGKQALNSIADDPAVGLIFRKPKSDTNNFGPHLGFAWDPTGHGKWSIRGGGQIAYDVIPTNFAINSLPPELQTEQNPTLTCALAGAPAWCTSGPGGTPGPGFLADGGLLQVNVPPTTTAAARAATQALILDMVDPKVITWSLGVQHELFKDTSIEVRYVGTRSLELPVQKRLNSASAFDPNVPGGGITPLPTYLTAAAVPSTVAAPASTLQDFDNFLANTLFRPYAADGFFGNLTTDPPLGAGIYHAGSVDFMHRFAKGLYFRANYTYSKNIDNSTNELFSSYVNPRRAQDGYDFAAERGRSALDLPQKFAVTWVYDFPNVNSENRFLRGLAHNWEWSGSYLAQSGQPVTPLSDADANANGDAAGDRTIFNPNGVGLTGTVVNAVCNAGAGGATTIVGIDSATGNWQCGSENDANIVGYVVAPAAVGTNAGNINPKARFVQAQLGAKANIGRNTVSSPGLNIWNMSLFKTMKFTERASLQFRFQTFDTFNHQNYSIGLPTNNGSIDQNTNTNPLNTSYIFVDSPQFLNKFIFNGGSRTLELGLRFSW